MRQRRRCDNGDAATTATMNGGAERAPSTSAQMTRSPVLKLYLRLQPVVPNLMRPSVSAWKKHNPKSVALNSVGLALASIRSSLKLDHARRRLDLRSAGASLATLTHDWRRLSGNIFMNGMGGGSAEMKQRKSAWAVSLKTSSFRSSTGTVGRGAEW